MARHLFIAQQTLSTWMEQDKISFDGHVMTILADGRKFTLIEAVRFILVEGGDEDAPGIIGKVKTGEQLVEMGAERYRDSVIYSDLAYKVQEGFIGEVFLNKDAEDVPADGKVQAEKAEKAEVPSPKPVAPKPPAVPPPPPDASKPVASEAKVQQPAQRQKKGADDKSGRPLEVARTQESMPAVAAQPSKGKAEPSSPEPVPSARAAAQAKPLELRKKAPSTGSAPVELTPKPVPDGSKPVELTQRSGRPGPEPLELTQEARKTVPKRSPVDLTPEDKARSLLSKAVKPEPEHAPAEEKAVTLEPAVEKDVEQDGISDEELLTKFLLENL